MSAETFLELREKMDLLDKALLEIKPRGVELAQAECNYKTALAAKMLELRAEGMPATITPDLARGDAHVAELRLKRDVAEALYKSAYEGINILKLSIKILESEIDREYRSNK